MRRPSASRPILVAACLAVLASSSPVASAQPAKDKPAASANAANDVLADPRLLEQAPMQDIVIRIQHAVAGDPDSGYAGAALDNDAKSVVLYWKGKVPAEITELVAAQAVPVHVRAVAFNRAEFLGAARALTANPPAAVGNDWTRVGPLPDYSGLELETSRSISPDAVRGLSVNGIPVRVTVGGAALEPAAWRWSDSSPFWGGAAMDRPFQGDLYYYCTTAFGVTLAFPQTGILTAQHCGTNVDWRTPVGDVYVGRSQTGRADLDANIITGGQSYGESIYVGPWDASDACCRRIVGQAGYAAQNMFVAPSGSWSGASVVRATTPPDQFVNLRDHGVVGPGFLAFNDDGVASVSEGDSGGPTVGPHSTGLPRVTALGIIVGIDRDHQGPCVGVGFERLCSRESFHINAIDAAIGVGAIIRTG